MSEGGPVASVATQSAEAGDADTILVPLDGSPEAKSALPYAAALVAPGGTIVLLTVVATGEDQAGDDVSHAALDAAAAELRAAGFTIKTRVLTGDPATRILEAAANGGADVIVMASHGRGAIGRLLHGSVADRVARDATVPVMVARSAQLAPGPVGITRLVVPLDGSPLAEESLPVAIGISRRLGTPLLLVRAVNIAELMPPAVGMGEAIPFQIYDETEEEMEKGARAYLEATAASLQKQGLPVITRVLSGPPASAIAEVTHAGDVIVLTSHQRSGVVRWLMGSVAESLVRSDDCPVILVPASEAAAG
jgi:nucleotide-binding universal stress UspA family protein